MYLVPLSSQLGFQAMEKVYALAIQEAVKIFETSGIRTVISPLMPHHLGCKGYLLDEVQTFEVKRNVAIFFFGVMNHDKRCENLRWWDGPKKRPISEWPVYPVHAYADKVGVNTGDNKIYIFKSEQTFSIELLPSLAGHYHVFPLAYAVCNILDSLDGCLVKKKRESRGETNW